MAAVLDTHAAIWYLLDARSLSASAASLIDQASAQGNPVYLPSICLVEVVYLVERDRVPADAFDRLRAELNRERPAFRIAALDVGVAESVARVSRSAVPDMPDRIIAATALHLNLPLVTRDRRIQSAGLKTVW